MRKNLTRNYENYEDYALFFITICAASVSGGMEITMNYERYYKMLKEHERLVSEEDYNFFGKHNLTLYFVESEYSNEKVITDELKKVLLISKLKYKKNISQICSIGNALEKNGISYLVVKGIGIAQTYPEPFTRIMGDHDIIVKKEDFAEAKEVICKLGYSTKSNISTYKDVSLFIEGALTIELHHALLHVGREPYADVFTETLWYEPVKLELFCGHISVPSPEMHFKYIVLHMMKHLKGGGVGLKFLLDIKYYSVFYKIDLEKQLQYFNEIGYGEFYRAIITLCHYKVGMPVDSITWLYEREEKVIELLTEFIAESGAFGKGSEKHRITGYYEKYESSINVKNEIRLLLVFLFPPKDLISEKYGYINERHWLLPIAWAHRLFNILFMRKISIREKLAFLTRDDQFIRDKDYLMKTLGLRGNSEQN